MGNPKNVALHHKRSPADIFISIVNIRDNEKDLAPHRDGDEKRAGDHV